MECAGGFLIPQDMYIAVSGTSGSRAKYKSHSVGSTIAIKPNSVTAMRNGITQTTAQ